MPRNSSAGWASSCVCTAGWGWLRWRLCGKLMVTACRASVNAFLLRDGKRHFRLLLGTLQSSLAVDSQSVEPSQCSCVVGGMTGGRGRRGSEGWCVTACSPDSSVSQLWVWTWEHCPRRGGWVPLPSSLNPSCLWRYCLGRGGSLWELPPKSEELKDLVGVVFSQQVLV